MYSFITIFPEEPTFELSAPLICCKPALIYITHFLGPLINQSKLAKPLPILLLDNKLCLNNPKKEPGKLTKKIKEGIGALDSYHDRYPIGWKKKPWSEIVKVKLVNQSASTKKATNKFSSKELLEKVGYSQEDQSKYYCVIM